MAPVNLPAPGEPRSLSLRANGLNLRVWEWHHRLRGIAPTLVLVHATGFHGRCWDGVVPHLGQRHILAVDQRGHGGSECRPFDTWSDFGADLSALLDAAGISRCVGVGHSMGGYAVASAAASRPDLFQRLILIDPVILAPGFYQHPQRASPVSDAADHPVARRRRRFASVDDMQQRYRNRPPFARFTPACFSAYCQHALAPDQEDWVLACEPRFEAEIYHSVARDPNILQQLSGIAQPVRVVRAAQPPTGDDLAGFQFSPTWPELAAVFPHGQDVYRSDLTHFMPMEVPDLVADLILSGS